MTIQPQNPYAIRMAAGIAPTTESGGPGGEVLAAETRGKYSVAAAYNRIYNFNVTAQTLSVIASSLASKCSLYNPPTSSVNLELIDIDIGTVLATTVVDVVGIYWQGPTLASLATLSTIGVFGTNWFAGNLGGNPGLGNPYSALTHSGTPVRIDIVTFFGALTTTNSVPSHKEYDGKVVLPPGHVISVAMSTAASTASGVDVALRWMELTP